MSDMSDLKSRVLVAMSGGVDSSVAAGLLARDSRYEVSGVYMKNWVSEDGEIGDCSWKDDIEDARKVANKLGIDFEVKNFMKEYKSIVVDYMLDSYRHGITPNPDVMCNREIKFGILLDYALKNNYDFVATGHYAKKKINHDGSCDIVCAEDGNKNQTYFLALLNQKQVKRALFPLGNLKKSQVRELAKEYNFINAEKKDSQGICFIGNIKMSDFLNFHLEKKPGRIVNKSGEVLGEHDGLHLYTLGQRRGVRVPSNTYKKAYVVVEKKVDDNLLVVDLEDENEESYDSSNLYNDLSKAKNKNNLFETFKNITFNTGNHSLYSLRCRVGELSFINENLNSGDEINIQVRYRASYDKAIFILEEIHIGDNDRIKEVNDSSQSAIIVFESKQRALTPGQICAFYSGDVLLGGGVFKEIFYD